MTDTHRNHFLPQHYQLGFNCPEAPGEIWMFEKGTDRVRRIGIPKTGMKKDLYSYQRDDGTLDASSMEQYLTNKVEGPAIEVIDKVRNQEDITLDEKQRLAKYIAVMIKRVPRHWDRIRLSAPQIVNEKIREYEELINTHIRAYPEKSEQFEDYKRRGIEFYNGVSKDPPNSIVVNTINETLTEPIFNMHWIFLTIRHGRPLFTSDDPVYISEDHKLLHPLAELHFPISSSVVLYATNNGGQTPQYRVAGESIIREIHRRVTSSAQRFLYSPVNEPWIVGLAQQREFQLRRYLYRR